MLYLFGTMFIVAGILLSLLAGVGYALTIRGNRAALGYARVGVFGSLLTLVTLWLFMVALFLARRFDVEYVFKYSSRDLDTFFTIAASWAGQPGSFALWAMFSAIVAALLVHRTRHFEPYVLTIFMFAQAGLVGLMLLSNPFTPYTDMQSGLIPATPPEDGHGLNALLHNVWMLAHPPVLFVGYTLATVPFAFALGGLLRHDYDGWVGRAMPWTIAAWAVLGVAILLGAYWAYETLGWGGYWGWDPVENSSLVPWLVLTALFHGALIQRTSGGLRRTNIVLAIFGFLTTMYASFLTRSGVLTDFSVHSFVAEGLSTAMTVVMLVGLVASLVILAIRWRDIPVRSIDASFFSRDSFLVLAVLSLMIIAVVVWFGTSMPVISAIPGAGHTLQDAFGAVFAIDDGSALTGQPLEDGRFSLAPSFYKQTTPPLALVMMMLLVLAPLLAWQKTDTSQMLRAMVVPFVVAVVAAIVAILVGVRHLLSLAVIFVSIFAAGTNIVTIVRTLRSNRGDRRGWLFTGGQISHLGVCLAMIGFVGSNVYASPDERVVMSADDPEPVSIYGVDMTFNGWESTPDGKGALDITVSRGESSFNARPQLFPDRSMGGTMQTPAIKSYIWYDLYISPLEYMPEVNPNRPVLRQEQRAAIGPYQITFEKFDLDQSAFEETGVAEIGAQLNVLYEDEAHIVIPRVRLTADESELEEDAMFEDVPATLPGGHPISMKQFDPSQRAVLLEVGGLDLPVRPARAVVAVSTKPLVILVWAGIIISTLGGGIAIYRRHIEQRARLRGQPVRLPRGLAEQG